MVKKFSLIVTLLFICCTVASVQPCLANDEDLISCQISLFLVKDLKTFFIHAYFDPASPSQVLGLAMIFNKLAQESAKLKFEVLTDNTAPVDSEIQIFYTNSRFYPLDWITSIEGNIGKTEIMFDFGWNSEPSVSQKILSLMLDEDMESSLSQK